MDQHQDTTMTLANDDLPQHMFVQYLQTQAFDQATKHFITKFECTLDPEVFFREGPFTEIFHERLDSLK